MMAKSIQAFRDERGNWHDDPASAVMGDISAMRAAWATNAFADLNALAKSQPFLMIDDGRRRAQASQVAYLAEHRSATARSRGIGYHPAGA